MALISFQSAVNYLSKRFVRRSAGTTRLKVLLFLAITTPVLALAIFSYVHIDKQLAQFSFLRRQAVAYLAASTLRAKFDNTVDIATFFATNEKFRALAEDDKWQEAIDSLAPDFASQEIIGHVTVIDTTGAQRGTSGEPGGLAKMSHAGDEWFQTVMKTGNPHISNVFNSTTAEPHQEIVVAIPVRNGAETVIGVLAGHIQLKTLLDWSNAIDVGSQAETLFADRLGQAVIKGRNKLGTPVMADLSSFAPVEKALRFYRGVEVTFDPITAEQTMVAYEPVLRYGWSVTVKQPISAAFALRNSETYFLLWVYGLIFALNLLLAILVMSALNIIANASRREKIVFESVGEGLVVIDRHARIVDINPTAETMFGWPRTEATGRDFEQVLVAQDAKGRTITRDARAVWQALSGHKVSSKFNFIRKNGTQFPAAVTAGPLMVGEGVTGAVMVYRDISKEEELDRAKREFISVASHQLLTPVSAVKGFLSLILDGDFGPITEKQREYLGKLFHLNERMIELTEDLLSVSRIDMGVFEAVVEPVNMEVFIRAEVDAVRPIAATKKIRLEEDYGDQPMMLRISPKLVRSVAQNLLSNAIKYTPEGGQVTVKLKTENDKETGHQLLFSVTDTGYGIPESARAKIFSKFFRADNVRIMGTEGTGLGLYIVKSVMNLLHGQVWFESEEGRGTTFYAKFPEKSQTAPEHG